MKTNMELFGMKQSHLTLEPLLTLTSTPKTTLTLLNQLQYWNKHQAYYKNLINKLLAGLLEIVFGWLQPCSEQQC